MAETKIIITIDEDGKITASTSGIKGEMCLDELQKILGWTGNLKTLSKTDEFYEEQRIGQSQKLNNKNS